MGTFSSRNNIPTFSPDGIEEFEIKTLENFGPKIINNSNIEELEPYKFYQFGTVCNKHLRIFRLISHSTKYMETYLGEFSIGPGGRVSFPSQIRWSQDPNFEEGYTYQFTISNGIGSYIKVINS